MNVHGIDSQSLQSRMAQALAAAREGRVEELAQRASGAETLGAREMEEAGRAFEAYFARVLVQELRRTLPGGFFSGSGSDVYAGWFDEHVGAAISDRNSLGFAGLIRASMARGEILPGERSGEERTAEEEDAR